MRRLFTALPWVVRWIALPIAALVVFGSLVKLVAFVLGIVFWVLLFAAAVAMLIFAFRKVTSSSSSGGGW